MKERDKNSKRMTVPVIWIDLRPRITLVLMFLFGNAGGSSRNGNYCGSPHPWHPATDGH